MYRLTVFTVLIAVALLGIQLPVFANAPQGHDTATLEYAPGRVLVKFTRAAVESPEFNVSLRAGEARTGLPTVDAISRSAGAYNINKSFIEVQNREMDEQLGVSRWHTIYVPEAVDVQALAAQYAADVNVEAAHVDYLAHPMVPNDPMYSSQWGHNNTGQMLDYCWSCGGHPSGSPVGTPGFDGNVEAAWAALGNYGSSNVVIAILDSGVDVGHPDLNQVAGYDYGDNDSNPDDDSSQPGHGTACAGVAAAIADNGVGVAGVAGGCRIMPLKVANSAGSMYFSAIDNALYHAADNGADIISMSLGAATSSVTSTDNALQYAYNAGCTILAATGNENNSTISYPAINQYVIAVGAANPCDGRKRSSSSASEVNSGVSTDPNGYTCDGERWWGSNYGSTSQGAANAVDIIAPTILPTTDIQGSGGYDSGDYSMWFNGTSCATPFAAGVAALIKSQNPTWTPAQIRDQLRNTADDVVNVESGSGWDRYSGYGMINAGAALGGGGGPSNNAPTAEANGPYSGVAGSAISFSSAGSSDSDGSIVSYSWNFGDGATSSAANPSHVYSNAGTYTATLTVTDDQGATGVDQATVTVSAASCTDNTVTLRITFDNYPEETSWDIKNSSNAVVASGGTYGSQPDGSTLFEDICLADGDYTFTIYDSYGDGICCSYGSGSYELTSGGTTLASGGSFGSSEATPFTLGSGPANQAPTANAGGPYSGDEGSAISFDGSGSSDPDGDALSYSWDFGDGASGSGVSPSHTYAAAGTYTVTLTVDDGNGGTDSDQATVTVNAVGGGGDPVVFGSYDFESGWQGWSDGGSDCYRYRGSRSYGGSYSIRIRDNSGTASSMTSPVFDASSHSQLEVTFFFYSYSMENGEDFWLRYSSNGGSSWTTVAAWARGTHFNNNTFYTATVTIDNPSSSSRIRFQCDASANADHIYIDDVTFRGVNGAGGAASGIMLGDGMLDMVREGHEIATPEHIALYQNYPNPFNPVTQIKFDVAVESHVTLAIYDMTGRLINMLVDDEHAPGTYTVQWDGTSMNGKTVESGIYLYRLVAGDTVESRTMTLLK